MSNDLFAGIGVVPGTFLLPRPDANWTAWACVACDQYTSEPEYWQRVNTLVGHQPSTLRLILPECDLPAPPERIDAIHAAMRDALNVLHPGVTDGFVLLERTTSTGKRLGLVCCVDLERYRYDGAKTLIRPTEETVASRLPARLAVRNGAPLESSHVMLLLDDPQQPVEPCNQLADLVIARNRQGLRPLSGSRHLIEFMGDGQHGRELLLDKAGGQPPDQGAR